MGKNYKSKINIIKTRILNFKLHKFQFGTTVQIPQFNSLMDPAISSRLKATSLVKL